MTEPENSASPGLTQAEVTRIIRRLFIVAEILAKAKGSPVRQRNGTEKCTEKSGTDNLRYLEYEDSSETQ